MKKTPPSVNSWWIDIIQWKHLVKKNTTQCKFLVKNQGPVSSKTSNTTSYLANPASWYTPCVYCFLTKGLFKRSIEIWLTWLKQTVSILLLWAKSGISYHASEFPGHPDNKGRRKMGCSVDIKGTVGLHSEDGDRDVGHCAAVPSPGWEYDEQRLEKSLPPSVFSLHPAPLLSVPKSYPCR